MNDAYRPKVGDRVRRQGWDTDRWFDVEWVGAASVAGLDSGGEKLIYIASDWVLWVAPAKTVQLLVTVDTMSHPPKGAALLYWNDADPTDVAVHETESSYNWPVGPKAGVITRVVRV